MKKPIIFLSLVLLLVAISCRHNNYKVNLNGIDLDLSIQRIDKDLFSDDPVGLYSKLDKLKLSDKEFIGYLGSVLNLGYLSDSLWNKNMLSFVTDKQNVEVYTDVASVYPDIESLEIEMEEAWKHYSYYYPDLPVPEIYTCVTGFNNSLIVGDSVIGVALERYLGSDCKYYPMLGIYNYQSLWMIPEKIVPDCIYAWASATWLSASNKGESVNLLETMIHEGRLLFHTRSMLPELADTLLFGFRGPQMSFVQNNEKQMWEYIIEHDLLFSTDPLVIRKLTGVAPFTSYFTNESPGKAACWLGFRIVESYMRRNQGVGLPELMKKEDMHSILEGSKYTPR